MDFEWDAAKAGANRERHGISFDEVRELFTRDVDYLEIYDAEHSRDEDRFIAIGPVRRGWSWLFTLNVTRTQCESSVPDEQQLQRLSSSGGTLEKRHE